MKKFGLLFAVVISFASSVSCVSKEMPVTETYYETEYKTESYSEMQDVIVDHRCSEDFISPKWQWYSPTLILSACGKEIWYFGYEIPRHDTSRIKVTFVQIPMFRANIVAYDLSDVGQIPEPPGGQWVFKGSSQYYSTYEWGNVPGSDDLSNWMRMCNNKLSSARRLSEKSVGTWSVPTGSPEPLELDVTGVTDLAIIACAPSYSPYFATFAGMPIKPVELIGCDNVVEKKSVTKEKQVPYQVEKQRTVMQMKKVPFWEAIFNK